MRRDLCSRSFFFSFPKTFETKEGVCIFYILPDSFMSEDYIWKQPFFRCRRRRRWLPLFIASSYFANISVFQKSVRSVNPRHESKGTDRVLGEWDATRDNDEALLPLSFPFAMSSEKETDIHSLTSVIEWLYSFFFILHPQLLSLSPTHLSFFCCLLHLFHFCSIRCTNNKFHGKSDKRDRTIKYKTLNTTATERWPSLGQDTLFFSLYRQLLCLSTATVV